MKLHGKHSSRTWMHVTKAWDSSWNNASERNITKIRMHASRQLWIWIFIIWIIVLCIKCSIPLNRVTPVCQLLLQPGLLIPFLLHHLLLSSPSTCWCCFLNVFNWEGINLHRDAPHDRQCRCSTRKLLLHGIVEVEVAGQQNIEHANTISVARMMWRCRRGACRGLREGNWIRCIFLRCLHRTLGNYLLPRLMNCIANVTIKVNII